MPQRIFFIVVVLIFLFNGEILGQQKNVEKIPVISNKWFNPGVMGQYHYPSPFIKKPILPVLLDGEKINDLSFLRLSASPKLFTPITKDFYCNNLSFFCRKEWQIEKATSIPLRFRLGSLEYTDYLEKKPNAILR